MSGRSPGLEGSRRSRFAATRAARVIFVRSSEVAFTSFGQAVRCTERSQGYSSERDEGVYESSAEVAPDELAGRPAERSLQSLVGDDGHLHPPGLLSAGDPKWTRSRANDPALTRREAVKKFLSWMCGAKVYVRHRPLVPPHHLYRAGTPSVLWGPRPQHVHRSAPCVLGTSSLLKARATISLRRSPEPSRRPMRSLRTFTAR